MLGLVFVALLAAAASVRAVEEDEGVLVLTDDNFDSVVDSEDIILVEFYAPWCGHCKSLAPNYAAAAKQLKADNVPLAKVDATEQTKVASRFSISGYPTLKVFRKGTPTDYSGPRDTAGIVSYMRKQAAPALRQLTTAAEYDVAVKRAVVNSDILVLAFFEDESSAKFKLYKEIAERNRDDYTFAYSTSEALRTEKGRAANSIVVLSGFETPVLEFPGDVKDLVSFLRQNDLGLVFELNDYTRPRVARRNLAVATLWFDIQPARDPAGMRYYANRLRKVASRHVGTVLFGMSNSKANEREMEQFGHKGKTAAFGVSKDGKRYAFPGDVTKIDPEAIASFVSDVLAGRVEPHIKSEPIPEQTGPVTVVVGKNFDEIVNDPTKNVLIEFYAPWCGHCKSLAPKYDQLGEKIAKEYENVVIAKMDATANDVPSPFEVNGFPTIYFSPIGSKMSPKKYEGGREVTDFASYIKKNGVELKKKKKSDEL